MSHRKPFHRNTTSSSFSASDLELPLLSYAAPTSFKVLPPETFIDSHSTASNFGIPAHHQYDGDAGDQGPKFPPTPKAKSYTRLGSTYEEDIDNKPVHRGWRKAVFAAVAITGIILFMNIIITLVTVSRFKARDGVGTIWTGRCSTAKRWNTALHLIINVLGTLLLTASSYTMQCLNSPTRTEVDRAHQRDQSLDIGLSSVRNLFYLPWWKSMLWIALCLSTLPLHLFWNSTVFVTRASNLFSYVLADESFLSGAPYEAPDPSTVNTTAGSRYQYYTGDKCHGFTDLAQGISNMYNGYHAGNFTNMTVAECVRRYTAGDGSEQKNLIIITEPHAGWNMSRCGYNGQVWNGSSVIAVDNDVYQGSTWAYNTEYNIYPSGYMDNITHEYYWNWASIKNATQKLNLWYVGPYRINYCLSETKNAESCKLQYASWILYIVTASNCIKFTSMAATAYYLWNLDEPILATIGDAVVSFTTNRDETTRGCCLADYKTVKKRRWFRTTAIKTYSPVYSRQPSTTLYSATSHVRWWLTMMACSSYLIGGGIVLGVTLVVGGYTPIEALHQRFGAVNEYMMIAIGNTGVGLLRGIIITNSFQLSLSILYFLVNSLFTAQCAAREWATFAQKKPQPLRVTWPRGSQKSTYYLQLPYKFGIPMTVFLMLMHFLISQSIFVTRLFYYDSTGTYVKFASYSACGWSSVAILITCSVWTVLLAAQVINAFMTVDNRIPMHRNKSILISAMCHPNHKASISPSAFLHGKIQQEDPHMVHEEEIDTNLCMKPIMWGETKEPAEYVRLKEGTDMEHVKRIAGHCGFATRTVEAPSMGLCYH